jgi:phosphoesterase RecJ-like protein
MILLDIGKKIKKFDNFAIVSHVSPDGDSLGSTLGLYSFLGEIGKNVDMFIDDVLPSKYSYLPNINYIKSESDFTKNYSCLFVLDCGDEERLGKFKNLISKCETVINIDHHISNTLFGHLNVVDSNASSVGEMIYQLIKINGFEISKDTAVCLYTSILSDTGGFKYSNTTSMTLSIAGDLINQGIDFSDIYNRIFDVKTVAQVKLLSKVSSTLELEMGGKVALLYLTQHMLKECNAKDEDVSDFVNIARDIDGVEIGVFIKEVDNMKYKASLRSKKHVDVRKIAEKFGGGGHIKAAGCTIYGSMDVVKQKIIDEIKNSYNGLG